MKIEAALALGPGLPFAIRTVDLDEPRDDELRVRIAGVGLCHTDLGFRDAAAVAFPAVLGHEGAGIVEAVGARVRKVGPGDRVVITFGSCGTCPRCVRGDPAYCHDTAIVNHAGARRDGTTALSLDGRRVAGHFFGQSSFASHVVTSERNVVVVPDGLPLERMGPLGCGVQTGAGAILRSLACEAGSSLLVTGGGSVGLSAVMAARIAGCGVVAVVEPHAARRALALELGATHALDAIGEADLASALRSLVPTGFDHVFESSGIPAMQRVALDVLAMKGVLGLVGYVSSGAPLPVDVNRLMGRGQTIKGIIEGDSDPDDFLPTLMAYHRDGLLPFDRLITTWPFHSINDAVAAQQRGECIKAVLTMDA